MTDEDTEYRHRLSIAVRNFMTKLDDLPGWKEWNRGKFGHTLHFDDDFWRPDDRPDVFEFDPETDKQHAVIMRYFALLQTPGDLRDLEFYFRRFPYVDTPITRYGHLSNCCELYFSRFYQFKERMKELFDAVQVAVDKKGQPFGGLIRLLDKQFEPEMRERHAVHHRERFEDIEISRVFLIESIMLQDDKLRGKGRTREHRRVYRKAAATWAKRCVDQADRLDIFTEVIAKAVLETCPFLDATESSDTPEARPTAS